MNIQLTKTAKVGTITRYKGWTGEVDDALGQSIINSRRAVEVGGVAKKKVPTRKSATSDNQDDKG